jgi:hypothetical protein
MGSSVSTDLPQKPKPINKKPPIRNGQRVNKQLVRPPGIPRPLVIHGGLPVGNYVVVRVPVIYAPHALYYIQQSPMSPHVYVSPSHYYTPVAVSQLPQVSIQPQPSFLPPLVVPQPVLVYNPPASSQIVIKNNIQTPPAPVPAPVPAPAPAPINEKPEIKMDITTDNSTDESELETYSYSDSEEDEIENCPKVNEQNYPKVEDSDLLQKILLNIAQDNDDVAYAIQLENILNLEQSVTPVIPPFSVKSPEEALTVDEIIHLYKSGEPVDDHINFYIALNPEKAADIEKLLENEVSSQSILLNVQQYYKERDPYPTIDDDFIIDYFTPSDDEVQENWAYED